MLTTYMDHNRRSLPCYVPMGLGETELLWDDIPDFSLLCYPQSRKVAGKGTSVS